LKLAIARRISAISRRGRKPVCCVVSTGGTASTAIMKHISAFTCINEPGDEDGLKHIPKPIQGVKTLFIWRTPVDAARSVRRRGIFFLRHHGAKLGSIGAQVLPTQLAHNRVAAKMNRQIRAFLLAETKNPELVYCVSFPEVFSKAEEIARFLEIRDHGFVMEFPTQRGV
jgi:hypothetical protein